MGFEPLPTKRGSATCPAREGSLPANARHRRPAEEITSWWRGAVNNPVPRVGQRPAWTDRLAPRVGQTCGIKTTTGVGAGNRRFEQTPHPHPHPRHWSLKPTALTSKVEACPLLHHLPTVWCQAHCLAPLELSFPSRKWDHGICLLAHDQTRRSGMEAEGNSVLGSQVPEVPAGRGKHPWSGAREVKDKCECFQSLTIPWGLCFAFTGLLLGLQALKHKHSPFLTGRRPRLLFLGNFPQVN